MVGFVKASRCVFLLGLFCASSFGGQFSMVCHYPSKNCGSEVVDIVSDRFTSRYPSDQWQLVVLAEFTPYTNGGGVGYAIAGVAKKITSQAMVPRNRFVSTSRRVGRTLLPAESTKESIQLVREAVEQMMLACDKTLNCDID